MNRSTRLSGVLLTGLLMTAVAAYAGSKPRFNAKGNILIADRYNNSVIEIDTNTQTIVWPCDAERVHSQTLIVGGGLPSGASTNYPSGAVDNRVIIVDRKGKITWQ